MSLMHSQRASSDKSRILKLKWRLSVRPFDESAIQELTELSYLHNNHDTCIDVIKRSVDLKLGDQRILYEMLGRCYFRKWRKLLEHNFSSPEDIKNAIICFKKSVHLSEILQVNPILYFEITAMHVFLGNHRRAIDTLTFIITLLQDNTGNSFEAQCAAQWVEIARYNIAQLLLTQHIITETQIIYDGLLLDCVRIRNAIEYSGVKDHVCWLPVSIHPVLLSFEVIRLKYRVGAEDLAVNLYEEWWKRLHKVSTTCEYQYSVHTKHGEATASEVDDENMCCLLYGSSSFMQWFLDATTFKRLGDRYRYKYNNLIMAAEMYNMASEVVVGHFHDLLKIPFTGRVVDEITTGMSVFKEDAESWHEHEFTKRLFQTLDMHVQDIALSYMLDRANCLYILGLYSQAEECAHFCVSLHPWDCVVLGRAARCVRRGIPANDELLRLASSVYFSVKKVMRGLRRIVAKKKRAEFLLMKRMATRVNAFVRMVLVRNKYANDRLAIVPVRNIWPLIRNLRRVVLRKGRQAILDWLDLWNCCSSRITNCFLSWYRLRIGRKVRRGFALLKRFTYGNYIRRQLRYYIEKIESGELIPDSTVTGSSSTQIVRAPVVRKKQLGKIMYMLRDASALVDQAAREIVASSLVNHTRRIPANVAKHVNSVVGRRIESDAILSTLYVSRNVKSFYTAKISAVDDFVVPVPLTEQSQTTTALDSSFGAMSPEFQPVDSLGFGGASVTWEEGLLSPTVGNSKLNSSIALDDTYESAVLGTNWYKKFRSSSVQLRTKKQIRRFSVDPMLVQSEQQNSALLSMTEAMRASASFRYKMAVIGHSKSNVYTTLTDVEKKSMSEQQWIPFGILPDKHIESILLCSVLYVTSRNFYSWDVERLCRIVRKNRLQLMIQSGSRHPCNDIPVLWRNIRVLAVYYSEGFGLASIKSLLDLGIQQLDSLTICCTSKTPALSYKFGEYLGARLISHFDYSQISSYKRARGKLQEEFHVGGPVVEQVIVGTKFNDIVVKKIPADTVSSLEQFSSSVFSEEAAGSDIWMEKVNFTNFCKTPLAVDERERLLSPLTMGFSPRNALLAPQQTVQLNSESFPLRKYTNKRYNNTSVEQMSALPMVIAPGEVKKFTKGVLVINTDEAECKEEEPVGVRYRQGAAFFDAMDKDSCGDSVGEERCESPFRPILLISQTSKRSPMSNISSPLSVMSGTSQLKSPDMKPEFASLSKLFEEESSKALIEALRIPESIKYTSDEGEAMRKQKRKEEKESRWHYCVAHKDVDDVQSVGSSNKSVHSVQENFAKHNDRASIADSSVGSLDDASANRQITMYARNNFFVPELMNVAILRKLTIERETMFGDRGVVKLFSLLQYNNTLEQITIRECNLSISCAQAISHYLSLSSTIQTLNFNNNKLCVDAVYMFVRAAANKGRTGSLKDIFVQRQSPALTDREGLAIYALGLKLGVAIITAEVVDVSQETALEALSGVDVDDHGEMRNALSELTRGHNLHLAPHLNLGQKKIHL